MASYMDVYQDYNYFSMFQLGLLDFGATREYRPFFVNNYFKIIDGAAKGDRDQILEYSRKVGFLTGYESKVKISSIFNTRTLHLNITYNVN